MDRTTDPAHIDRCSICSEPAHASETDDLDRSAAAAGDPHVLPERAIAAESDRAA